MRWFCLLQKPEALVIKISTALMFFFGIILCGLKGGGANSLLS